MKFLCKSCNHYFSNLEMIHNEDQTADCLPCWFQLNRHNPEKVNRLYADYVPLVKLIGKGPLYGEPSGASSSTTEQCQRFSANGLQEFESSNTQRINLWHTLITQRLGCQHPTLVSFQTAPPSSPFVLLSSPFPLPTSPLPRPTSPLASSSVAYSNPFADERGRHMGQLSRDIYKNADTGILCPQCLRAQKRVPLDRCCADGHPRW